MIKSISLLTREEGMTHEQFEEQKRPASSGDRVGLTAPPSV